MTLEAVVPLKLPVCPLTRRQLEIVRLLADGRTRPQVAAELFLSESTVKTHLSVARAIVDRPTTTGLVALALRRGWIA